MSVVAEQRTSEVEKSVTFNKLTVTMTQAVDHLTTDRVKDTNGAVIATTHHPRSSQGRSDLQAYVDMTAMLEGLR
jgi:hypothetical protein